MVWPGNRRPAWFYGREIVRDDVDLACARLGGHDLGQKVNNSALVWRGAAAKDFPASGIKGRVKRKGAVPVISKPWPRLCRRKRQDRIQRSKAWIAVFRRAEDGSMIRRVQVKADNVGGLLLEVGSSLSM